MRCRLVLLLFVCALGCNDAHSSSHETRAVAGSGSAGASDAGSRDAGSGSSGATIPVAPPAAPGIVTTPSRFESCEHDGQRHKLGEWVFDRARCSSRLCTRSGWDDHDAFCGGGMGCDGGACDECLLGSQRFPVGEGLVCSDGCNHCTCTGDGLWLQTLVLCDRLPPVTPCQQVPEADTTRAVFLAGESLSLRADFAHGGCEFAAMRACYRVVTSSSGAGAHARIWLEPEASLVVCEVPFIAEAVFSVAPLRDLSELTLGRQSGAIDLVLANGSIAYSF